VTDDAVIRFDRVTKAFGSHRVLDEISFEVRKGEAFCILGRSGTGKSVTLKQTIGLLRPDSGSIHVYGEDLASLNSSGLSKVRKRVGFLFQYSALFDSITVGENVAFPLRRHTRLKEKEIQARVTALLEQVGLAEHLHKRPDEISGGMRKRVGLARAMALDPGILLADEPSSGLDPVTSQEIDDLLLKLKRERGTTLVVVTHNIPSALRIGDTLAFLHGGKFLDKGPPSHIEKSSHQIVKRFMSVEGGT